MIENGLTKKINPNTNIFNSVINAVQTFKELFTWRHNEAPNIACKTRRIYITARCTIARSVASKGVRNHFSLIMKLNKKVIFSFFVKYGIHFHSTCSWKYVAFYHVSWKYIPYFTQTKKFPLNMIDKNVIVP
jgi:hypothetical protein